MTIDFKNIIMSNSLAAKSINSLIFDTRILRILQWTHFHFCSSSKLEAFRVFSKKKMEHTDGTTQAIRTGSKTIFIICIFY